eukprot:scaffold243422_cov20-Prasinocladus_malaysianus.AAC.1
MREPSRQGSLSTWRGLLASGAAQIQSVSEAPAVGLSEFSAVSCPSHAGILRRIRIILTLPPAAQTRTSTML